MCVTATELKQNLGKYLELCEKEDVFITKNGKVIAKLSNPFLDREAAARSIFGCISKDTDLEMAREERLAEK